MGARSGYILCGTPRTGSTLLWSLLSSTGVLGRPESYFREPDEATWAQRLGLPTAGARAHDYPAFVAAVRHTASTENGVLGIRIMWGSLERITAGLRESSGEPELATLERALGPLTFVHLRRENLVEQAVSWARAEQTGYWQHGDVALRQPRENINQMRQLLATIRQHNHAWESWFRTHEVEPLRVSYEQVASDPRTAVEAVATHLEVALPRAWAPNPIHQRQADEVNETWALALRASLAANPL